VKKILAIVFAVILTLTLLLTSLTFAAGGKKEVNLAQESGQAWLDSTVAVIGEPEEWVGAQLTAPQVCYDLKGKPNAYMFAIENDGVVVGYIIVGSADYGYPMFEAADVPPPAVPSADEVKSTLKRDLGLDVASIGRPTRLLYLGFDNLFAVYQAGRQEVAVDLKFDFAVPASNLKAAIPSPEDYKANKKATQEAKPELLDISSAQASVMPRGLVMLEAKYLEMDPYCSGWCGPASGVSIGRYYRDECDYDDLPSNANMYSELYQLMGTAFWYWLTGWGATMPADYGPGFVAMTEDHGYDNFSYYYDAILTGGDYWNRVADINSGWPIALGSLIQLNYYPGAPDVGHWVAIRGYLYYQYSGEPIETWVRCTDSYVCSDTVWIDWTNIGFAPFTVTIKDS